MSAHGCDRTPPSPPALRASLSVHVAHVRPHEPVAQKQRWPSLSVEALCLEAEPERVALLPDGEWDFPLRAGYNGVFWSRQEGYSGNDLQVDNDLLEELGG